MPQTRWGWWSVGLAAAFVLFLTLTQLAVAFGQTGNSPVIVVPFSFALVSGTAALLGGIAGIIWRKERSILVFLSAAVGLVVTALWVEQIVSAFLRVTPPPPPPNPPRALPPTAKTNPTRPGVVQRQRFMEPLRRLCH